MADASIQQSGGDFTSINAFIGDAGTSGGDTGTISGTWSSADTTAITWDKAVIIVATGDSKQIGRPFQSGDDHYRHSVTSGHSITVTANVDITDVDIHSASTTASDEIFRATGTGWTTLDATNCMLGFGSPTTEQDILYHEGDNDYVITFEQCFFHNTGRSIVDQFGVAANTDIVCNFNSCASYAIATDDGRADAGWYGSDDTTFANSSCTVNAHNCLMHTDETYLCAALNASGTFDVNAHYSLTNKASGGVSSNADNESTTGSDFSYTWTAAADPGAGSRVGMVDITGDDYDPNLTDHANNDAIGFHATVTSAGLTIPDNDLTGLTRDKTTPDFDVGPHTITVATGGVVPAIMNQQGMASLPLLVIGGIVRKAMKNALTNRREFFKFWK